MYLCIDLDATEISKIAAGGSASTASVSATAEKVGLEPAKNTVINLSPEVLAMASACKVNDCSHSTSDSSMFQGAAQPKKSGGLAATA